MSFPVYVVSMTRVHGSSGGTSIHLDSVEANERFDSMVKLSGHEYSVVLQRISIEIDQISEIVDEILEEGNGEVMNTHSPEDLTWDELSFRPEGIFYLERLKASSSEYWPYTAEPIEGGQWLVFNDTVRTKLGVIRPDVEGNGAFLTIVNGNSRTGKYGDMKSAMIAIILEAEKD